MGDEALLRMKALLKKPTKFGKKTDPGRFHIENNPPCLWVKSDDSMSKPEELGTWVNTFGMKELIAGNIAKMDFGGEKIYLGATNGMRPLDAPFEGYWVIVSFGMWVAHSESGYRGHLVFCRDGDEEHFGERFMAELHRDLRIDQEMWALKNSIPLGKHKTTEDPGYSDIWLPEYGQEGEKK